MFYDQLRNYSISLKRKIVKKTMMKLSARRVPQECFDFGCFEVFYNFGYLASRGFQCYYFQM